MSLRVLKAGPLTLLQDLGRKGCASQGMSPGGPMDEHAFAWANHLLDNPADAAQIEITLGPCQLRAEKPLAFALTGADMDASINGQPVAPWSSGQLEAGECLTLKTAKFGLRGYLAVRGGFQVEPHFGSCSTVMREGLGGLHGDGAPLKVGDLLSCAHSRQLAQRQTPWTYRPRYHSPARVRFLPGPEFDCLAATQRQQLLRGEFTIQAQSNRMGYRLQGPRIAIEHRKLSEGQCKGSIQLPPDGNPIILMADHQTIGGYPNLGTVIRADISRLAQLRPGQSIHLQLTPIDEAIEQSRQFDEFFGHP